MCENIPHDFPEGCLAAFQTHLVLDEKSQLTVGKYLRDVRRFRAFLGEEDPVTKQRVLAYKDWLSREYAVSSANSMLAALNSFFAFLGWYDCRVRTFKAQKQVFYEKDRELKREEYLRLITAAEERGDRRLAMLLQTICSAGLRVSELSCVTVEAAGMGVARVRCKGKSRVVMLPSRLCGYLLDYCRERGIASGQIFITRNGRPMDRSNIWKMMKALSVPAQVPAMKVFPHNLRHLFARTFYDRGKDIVRLADILGHRSVDTTRIYTASSGDEHGHLLEALQLLAVEGPRL